MDTVCNQQWLDSIFPAERTDAFFEALFGGAEEGAYDIRLVFRSKDDVQLNFAFELHQRPGKCLACNLTYGLPQVFQRHPVINVKGVAEEVAKSCGWEKWHWALGATEERSRELHCIPFAVFKD